MAALVIPSFGLPEPAPLAAAQSSPASFRPGTLPSMLAGSGPRQSFRIPGRGKDLAPVLLHVHLKQVGGSSTFVTPTAFVADPMAVRCEGVTRLLRVAQTVARYTGAHGAADTLLCETSSGASKMHRFSEFYAGLKMHPNWGKAGASGSQQSAAYAATCTARRDGGNTEIGGLLYFGETGQGSSALQCMENRVFEGHAKGIVDLLCGMDKWASAVDKGSLSDEKLASKLVGTLPKSVAAYIRQLQTCFPSSELRVDVVFHYIGVGRGLDGDLGGEPNATPQKLCSRAVEALCHHLHLLYCKKMGLRSLLMVSGA
jgi:hypothetical protein